MATKIRFLLRYIFVGALSLFPLILVIVVVNYLKNLGVSAYSSLHDYTNSFGVTLALMAGVIAIFALLGFSIEKYGRSIFVSMIDSTFEKIPAIRSVYSVSKKLAAMLSGGEDGTKKEVVLVEYPKEGLWVPAYLLNRHENICVVFIPTSPNPTSGYTVLVDESLIKKTSLSLQEASSFIISMGADFPQKEAVSMLIQNANEIKSH
ncbi:MULTISPECIES: DUF502 domain-containing protein [unclassified Sulfuricurvum]|uniref:DUF502 domain-containing protein n=1 Tax=unclassified Sulfuricurvum TaxID=2632390 RepID=UPI0002995EB6|nr:MULTISPECIES: DUF502 domain-containing protein [unclassified Sulfuricurvum]OHD83308.1 MAG: hypothetical protein A3J39_01725 [Sulfuricurvum sp. RIFCSPHIGHO2_12_FULL_44_8]OHD84630.1 MAG: hypothetical protein A3D90_10270 [Sulfuricurvum sp. RIFCSPHIGHO2_02_FULL_43_9]OHD86337.1 MAG: hypothetical protein A3I60_00310 [Sulfuricurvum sp. RIFCSPLOWO2_02_FULL_43_45]OHD87752.1 MAG: hypothetical protein A2Y52_09740 [Sulfuricurvum sp. RIFCSPLOWO2_02_43_6]AFV98090.1 hypothetical protein B649_08890 [Candid